MNEKCVTNKANIKSIFQSHIAMMFCDVYPFLLIYFTLSLRETIYGTWMHTILNIWAIAIIILNFFYAHYEICNLVGTSKKGESKLKKGLQKKC